MTTLSASKSPLQLLESFGPERCDSVSETEALEYTRRLAGSHYENFSVLSTLLPRRFRQDFANVYAFCRWADDLGDETGSTEADRNRSIDLLEWWRRELEACFRGRPTHPVYIAMQQTIQRCELPAAPFHNLIDAFVQDQRVRRYGSLNQVLDYCKKSADPVGRLVLRVTGQIRSEDDERLVYSDAICTALQLANHWQDVRRDLLERDRIYLPLPELGIRESELRTWIDHPDDAEGRASYCAALRPLIEHTQGMFLRGAPLLQQVDPQVRPVIDLFYRGGMQVLRAIERIEYATLWQRPVVSRQAKLRLVGRAWLGRMLGQLLPLRRKQGPMMIT